MDSLVDDASDAVMGTHPAAVAPYASLDDCIKRSSEVFLLILALLS